MKKKILTVATIAMLVSIATSGTLAYFNAKGQAHNVITTGGVGIEIVEKIPDGDDPDTELDDFEDVSGVMPGADVDKIVTVKNIGEAEAWIRVWVNVGISESGDPITNPTIKNLPLTITTAAGKEIDVITYEVDESKWLHGEDGYYYYLKPVDKGDSTDILFDKVHFAKEMGNEYQNCIVLIDVSAEAVQTANNPIPSGGDVSDIKGWPKN